MNPRYFQQHLVRELGFGSEEKLKAASLLIVGCGGLGTPVATTLAAMGVGRIVLADGDSVEISNLHRQFQFTEADLGKPKAEILAQKLKLQNPEIIIEPVAAFIGAENAEELIRNCDLVCDCSDNPDTRLLVDDICGELKKPLVFAAVRAWEGHVTVLHASRGIALTEVFSITDLKNTEGCSLSGIVPTVCGIVGNVQATEALKLILGLGTLDGEIWCYDALLASSRKLKLKNTRKND